MEMFLVGSIAGGTIAYFLGAATGVFNVSGITANFEFIIIAYKYRFSWNFIFGYSVPKTYIFQQFHI